MSAKQIYRLVHRQARAGAQLAITNAPDGWIVTVSEPTRSLDQNALIHAELTEVGKALGWVFNGQKVDLDDLKTIFMAAFRKATGANVRFVVGLDGQPVIMNWRTRDLSKKDCSDFVEMVRAWRAEMEVAA